MLIKLGRFEFTECWDGVLYKNLPDYPQISEWEIQSVLDFIRYEEDNGRACEIEADEAILNAVEAARREKRPRVPVPQLLTEMHRLPEVPRVYDRLRMPYLAGGKRSEDI